MIAKCLRKIIRQLILILLVLYVKKRKIYSGYISKNDGDFDFFNCLHSLRTKKNKTKRNLIRYYLLFMQIINLSLKK